MDIHFRQSAHQGFLRALIALEQLGREPTRAVLRDTKLERANAGDQRALLIAGAVAEPGLCPFALRRAQRLRHLGFQRRLDRRPQEVRIALKQGFGVDNLALIFLEPWSWCAPRQKGW
jgi:hypothetical protein